MPARVAREERIQKISLAIRSMELIDDRSEGMSKGIVCRLGTGVEEL
jgi:hypothetical protein